MLAVIVIDPGSSGAGIDYADDQVKSQQWLLAVRNMKSILLDEVTAVPDGPTSLFIDAL